jgi:hypothetical protein
MMHPAVLQALAAEHVKDMVATADKARQAQQARRARRSRTSAGGTGRPAAHPVATRTTVSTGADRDRADTVRPISGVDTERPQEPAEAAHRHAPIGPVPC